MIRCPRHFAQASAVLTSYIPPRTPIKHPQVDGETIQLGRFDTAVEAAQKYDEHAKRNHGAKAKLNFPDESTNGHGSASEDESGGRGGGSSRQSGRKRGRGESGGSRVDGKADDSGNGGGRRTRGGRSNGPGKYAKMLNGQHDDSEVSTWARAGMG